MAKRGKTIISICKRCNKDFSALMIKIRKGGGKFCSRSCYVAYLKEKPKKYKNIAHMKRMHQIKNKYNLSEIDYNLLLIKQINKCAICDSSFTSLKKNPFVDHCHKTGKVRGLLCTQCNTLLGMAKDEIDLLYKAISYIEKHNGPLAQLVRAVDS